MIEGRI